jgi:hypothetical protein
MSVRLSIVAVGMLVAGVLGSGAAGASTPTTPGVPDALRISTNPYAGFQMCTVGPPLVDTRSGLLAASPTPWSPAGSPGLVGTFELALPDQVPFHRTSRAIESNGHTFAYQVPQDMLPDGEYRWRVRAENGKTVSAWSPWCSFTVRVRQTG